MRARSTFTSLRFVSLAQFQATLLLKIVGQQTGSCRQPMDADASNCKVATTAPVGGGLVRLGGAQAHFLPVCCLVPREPGGKMFSVRIGGKGNVDAAGRGRINSLHRVGV